MSTPVRIEPSRAGLPMAGPMVAVVRDPVRPALGMAVRQVPAGLSPAMALTASGLPLPGRYMLWRGSSALLRRHPVTGIDEWHALRLAQGDVLICTPPPAAGEEGGSNPIAMVAIIALMIVAPYAGAAIAGAGTTGAAVISTTIVVAGSALINAALPPPTPSSPAPIEGPASTFRGTLSGQLARIGARIPDLYGTVRFAPEWIAPPYGRFADNSHQVYALYSLGRGKVQLDQMEFEDTVIWTLADGVTDAGGDLELEICQPGEPVTLFPAEVTSSSEPGGQPLRATDELEEGETTEDLFVGPYAVCPAGVEVIRIETDIEWPSALFQIDEVGRMRQVTVTWRVEARPIDDSGTPTGDGSWTTLGEKTIRMGTTTPQRRSDIYPVTRGRWEVRVRRTNTTIGTAQASDATIWTGLKGHVPSDQVYDDETVLAIRFSGTAATAQSRRLFAVATAVRPYWDSGTETWVEGPTAAIEAALRHIAQDDAEAGLADHRVDLESLQVLAEKWAERGDRFSHRFTGDTTPWEEIRIAARAGRAQPIRIGADLTFVRDQVQTIPAMALAPQDIVRGSLTVERIHATDEDANAARVVYTRPDGVEESIDVTLEGVPPARISEIRFEGIDHAQQAWRETIYELASHIYRRRLVQLTTLYRGRFLKRGDLLTVAHYRPAWGQSGMVMALAADGRTLTLDEPMEASDDDDVLGLVTPDGRLWGPVSATVGGDDRTLVIDADDMAAYLAEPDLGRAYHSAPAGWVLTKSDLSKGTRAMFGPRATVWRSLLVIEARPAADGTVSIAGVEDDLRVHRAEVDTAQPAAVAASGPGLPSTAPTWLGVSVSVREVGDELRLTVVGPSVPGAALYRAAYQADAGDWVPLTPSPSPELTALVPDVDDSLLVEYWAEGPGGEGVRIRKNASAYVTPPAAVDTGSMAVTEESDGDLAFTWDTVSGATAYDCELLGGDTVDSLDLVRTAIAAGGAYSWTLSDQQSVGGPFRVARIRVRATSSGGTAGPAAFTYANPAPAAVGATVVGAVTKSTVALSWPASTDPTTVGYVIAYAKSAGFDPETSDRVVVADTPAVVRHLQQGSQYRWRVAPHDGSTAELNFNAEVEGFTPSLDPGEGP